MVKRKISKKWFVVFPAVFFVAWIVSSEFCEGRGFRGGFRGGFRRSSFGRSRSSGRSLFSSRRRSSRSSRSRYRSSADRRLAQKAKAKGTRFTSRSKAKSHFLKNNKSKYTSKYSAKPSTRPKHIPQTVQSNGKQYNVRYNPQYGGYGYMENGAWRFYSVARDAAMLSLLMRQNHYYYGRGHYGYRRGTSWFGTFVIILIVGGALYLVISSQKRNRYTG